MKRRWKRNCARCGRRFSGEVKRALAYRTPNICQDCQRSRRRDTLRIWRQKGPGSANAAKLARDQQRRAATAPFEYGRMQCHFEQPKERLPHELIVRLEEGPDEISQQLPLAQLDRLLEWIERNRPRRGKKRGLGVEGSKE